MVRYEFAEQWNIPCVVIQPGDTAEHVIKLSIEAEATYFDGEDTNYCVRFPDRPQELYTEEALRRSGFPTTAATSLEQVKQAIASQRAVEYARAFVAGDLVSLGKLDLVARNIQQIMIDIQTEAIEQAAQICETVPAGNRETVARAIRGLLPPEATDG